MFRRRQPAQEIQWLIIGLGNPGSEYRGTRHNAGFAVVDAVATAHSIRVDRKLHRSLAGFGQVQGIRVCLAKPLTYMNLSGQAAKPLMNFCNIAPSHVLVVSDDVDLGVGKLRLRAEGGSGGHNGHKSVIEALQTNSYPRLRFGVGRTDQATRDYVLDRFSEQELPVVEEALRKAVKVIEALLSKGMQAGQEQAARSEEL